MSFDISAWNPSPGCEPYIYLNSTSWGFLRAIMATWCDDLIDQETLEAMSCNFTFRAGVDSGLCLEIADRFDEVVAEMDTPKIRYALERESIGPLEVSDGGSVPMIIMRRIGFVHQWQNFLRRCGGFNVS